MTCVYLCLALLLASVAPATAETYPVRDSSGGQASAVCVGVMYGKNRTNPRWVFLTNRHVVTEQGRTVGVWVGSDDGKWIQGQSVRASNIKNRDVASFTVAHNAGQFRKVQLLEGVPDGATASVCGYSRFRDQFCLKGRLSGTQVTANGRHAMPGDSGGAVLVKESGKSYLAGLTWAYGDDQSTYVVTAKDCCSHLQWAYGVHPKCAQWHSVQQCPNGQCPMHPQQPSRPSYRRYERVQPQFLAPPRIERYEESTIPQTIEPPQPAPQPPVSEQRIQDAVTRWMESNHEQLSGKNGSDGRDPSLVLWSAFVSEYKRVGLQKKSANHSMSIRNSIMKFESHMKPRTLVQITTKFIEEFVGRRAKDRGQKPGSTVSPATINRDLRNLKLLFRVAVEWGQLDKMPRIRMVKAPQRIKRHVTPEHFAAMFAAAEQMKEPQLRNVTACEYWRALIAFAFLTGWRINEILNIRRDDVDFETGQVVARWDDSKGKRDELIFVPAALLELLQPVWRSFSERPMEWLGSRRSIYVPFSALQKLAGIDLHCEEAHKHTDACHLYGFHDFKRAFATNNASTLSPAQLQRLMKHSDFSTTQRYINYAKLMTERPDVYVPDVLQSRSGGAADSR